MGRIGFRFRLTLGRAGLLMAGLGVGLAAARGHPGLGVLAGSVGGLALIRTFEDIDRLGPSGGLGALDYIGRFAGALMAAAVLVLLPLAILVVVFAAFIDHGARHTPGSVVVGLAFAVPAAALVAVRLRRIVWPRRP
jgi:hypothetical protein